jgi:serine protein kinase
VQVERYFISRRYRLGAVTLGPELSVDAGERQVTADRSLSRCRPSLQATTLFEVHGELVEAAGGVLEFSDLLQAPHRRVPLPAAHARDGRGEPLAADPADQRA